MLKNPSDDWSINPKIRPNWTCPYIVKPLCIGMTDKWGNTPGTLGRFMEGPLKMKEEVCFIKQSEPCYVTSN